MIIIKESNFTSHHLVQLRSWFEEMWGPYEEFEETKYGIKLPSPLLAFHDKKLVGGLAFTAYKSPENEQMVLWINALYVDLTMRGVGIGAKLIRFAEEVSKDNEHKVLYAQTNVPTLYIKNGWESIEVNGEDVVLKKLL